jgi:hypothetical protein
MSKVKEQKLPARDKNGTSLVPESTNPSDYSDS